MSSQGKKENDPEKQKKDHEAPRGWRAIDLSKPPKGPLMRTRTSMGTEEPEWPQDEDDTSIEDEGDLVD